MSLLAVGASMPRTTIQPAHLPRGTSPAAISVRNLGSAISTACRQAIKAGFRLLGVDLRVSRPHHAIAIELRCRQNACNEKQLPPIFNDPLEAIYSERGDKASAFHCPIDQCVVVSGLNFKAGGWHPFSALLEEIGSDGGAYYENSILERYYQSWQPQNAGEALIGLGSAPTILCSLPSHLMYLLPWASKTPEETDHTVRTWAHRDNVEHGAHDLTIDMHGFAKHGPVHPRLGKLEFERLRQIFGALSRHGYDRTNGDVNVLVIKRQGDYRFLTAGGGLHRIAAMKALGHDIVPAKPRQPWVIDVDEVDHWPQVRNGTWSRTAAIRYIDHLFDFDAAAWAQQLGLTQRQSA